MKKIALVLFAFAIANASFSQKIKEAEVPELVKSSFQKLYPGIKADKWEKEKDNFEADFKIDKKEMSALFNTHGNQLEKEMKIPVSELPPAITTYLESQYQKAKIKDASRIISANGVVTYEADIGKSDLIFDENGQFIREDNDSEDDKD